jgi:hypothetical protein
MMFQVGVTFRLISQTLHGRMASRLAQPAELTRLVGLASNRLARLAARSTQRSITRSDRTAPAVVSKGVESFFLIGASAIP